MQEEGVDFLTGLPPGHHDVRQLNHITSQGKAVDVLTRTAERLDKLAAQDKGQFIRATWPESEANMVKGSRTLTKRRRERFAPFAIPVIFPQS